MIRPALVLAALLALGACRSEPEAPDLSLPGYDPHLVENAKAACEKREGRWGKGGKAGFVCYEDTPDAGRSCSAADDCSGLCLARSRTCAPVKPIFGCTEVLTSLGQASTLCID
ncbi:hypothetical protein [Oceaniglobus roseus]|uniref:hypothetical protein n=1 Tax=Oceaniglobus roseus TaxID=1737570 RepID=UPI001FE82BEC|nr:hypothetical protein [Kandeliimicrobium roseum]